MLLIALILLVALFGIAFFCESVEQSTKAKRLAAIEAERAKETPLQKRMREEEEFRAIAAEVCNNDPEAIACAVHIWRSGR